MNFPEGQQIGLIAGNVATVFPALTKKTYTYTKGDHKNEVSFDAVNYVGLIPVLTKAIQEQQTQMEEMKAKIAQLEKQLQQNTPVK